MKERRLTQRYVEEFIQIVFTQPLAHDVIMQQVYDKEDSRWRLTYRTTSIHHICPYDGMFRDCKECGALDEGFDTKFCTKKTTYITTGALIERIKDCLAADLTVDFMYD